ncbi:MAG: hypothetical protein AMK72_13510, partial [Planctomycetes bacterium SM23_25]
MVEVAARTQLAIEQPQANLADVTAPPVINVAALGAVGGDMTNARYNAAGPGPQNVFLSAGSVMTTITAGSAPARADLPNGGATTDDLLCRGIDDLAGTYSGLGDDGAGSIYRGAILDVPWTPGVSLVAGLSYGEVAGGHNSSDVNPATLVTLDLHETEDAITTYTTEVFTGRFYDADGHVSFMEHIDDDAWLYIDGSLVLDDVAYNSQTWTQDLALAPGWHDFELRISNQAGASGPQAPPIPGFGYDPDGGTAWVHPEDPGDGSLLRTFSGNYVFTGTLSEAPGAGGYEVRMAHPTTLQNAVVKAAAGHPVRFTGAPRLDLYANSFAADPGRADTVARVGDAPSGTNPGSTGSLVVFANETNSVPAGMALTVENGAFQMGPPDAIEAGAVLNIGPNGTYFTQQQMGLVAPVVPPANLIANWKFDDGTGHMAVNSVSPGDKDGTLTNFPVDDSQWVVGVHGGALAFDGTDDAVTIAGYKGVIGTDPRTVAGWIKASPTEMNKTIMSWGQDNAGLKWIFRIQDSNGTPGTIRVEVSGGYICGETVVNDDAWHHVAAVLPDGVTNVNQMLLYVDGRLETPSATLGEPINTASDWDVAIGADNRAGYQFLGTMDDLYLYDRALTNEEIQLLSGLTPTLSSGTFNVLAGGAVFYEYFQSLGTFNFNDGAMIVHAGPNLDWVAGEGLPTTTRLDLVVAGGDRSCDQRLYLGNGARLSQQVYEADLTITGTAGILPNTGMALDGSETVIISAPEGRTFTVGMDVNLAGVNLQIGDAPGSEPYLPGGSGAGYGRAARVQVPQTGEVQLFADTVVAHDVTIESGYLDLGNADTDHYAFTGAITIKDGADLEISQQADLQTSFRDGSLAAGGIYLENGGDLRMWIPADVPGGVHITTPIICTGGGSGAPAYMRFDESGVTEDEIFYFDAITFRDGTDLITDNQDTGRANVRLSITAAGGVSSIRRGPDQVSFQNVTGEGELLLGHADDGNYEFDVYGTLGGTDPSETVTLTLRQAYLYLLQDSHLTDQCIINSTADQGPGGIGEDGFVRVEAGQDGDPAKMITAGTINLAGRQDIELVVDEVPTGTPAVTNELSARINVLAQGTYERSPGEPVHGWLRANRGVNSNDRGTARFSNVHLADSAVVEMTIANGQDLIADLFLDGSTGTVLNDDNNNRIYVGNVTGNASTGLEVLNAGGANATRFVGVVDDVEIIWNNTNIMYLEPGFALINGSTITRGGTGEVHVYADFGTGSINSFVPGAGDLELVYGKEEDPDMIGDNGWGSGLTINIGSGDRILLRVDEPDTGLNVNKFEGAVIVLDDIVGGVDAILRAERTDNRTGLALSHFTNIRPGAGSTTELQRSGDNNTVIQADFNLVNGSADAVVSGGIFATVRATAPAPAVLTVGKTGGGNATLDLGIDPAGQADMTLNSADSGAIRVNAVSLGGHTLNIEGTGTTYPIEFWPECNADPGAGTGVDLGGGLYGGLGAEWRVAYLGGDAVEAPTQIEIRHGRMLSGFVATRFTQAEQTFAGDVKVIDDGTAAVDAVLRTRTSGVAADNVGWTPGVVKLASLTLGAGSKAELATDAADLSQLYLPAVHLEGNAEIANNDSFSRYFIGDVDG